MIVTFVLPGVAKKPVGGYKVIYEYANRLADKGHEVHIVHCANPFRNPSLWDHASTLPRFLLNAVRGLYNHVPWFELSPAVRLHTTYRPEEHRIPKSDVVIATAWRTAPWVASYGAEKGRKYYLIQDLESWDAPEENVLETWKLPLRKIVVSKWLRDLAKEIDEYAEYIPNGLDFQEFGTDVPVGQRADANVLMLYHLGAHKGTGDGLEALRRARRMLPNLSAKLFGTERQPKNIPDWVTYIHNPSHAELRRLYNTSAVFVSPSRREGWGLTACEAMMCGAAVAATDIGGHREYAEHESTALLSRPAKPDELAANIVRLVNDRELRLGLAKRAQEYVRRFQWTRSVDQLEQSLLASLERWHDVDA